MPRFLRFLVITAAAALLALLSAPAQAADRGTVNLMHDDHPSYRETFHVAGDVDDPAGLAPKGVAPGYRLTQSALGHPVVFYSFGAGGEILMTLDVYKLPEQPMYIHLLCPHCMARGHQNALRIVEGNKEISYDPDGRVPTFPGWLEADMVRALPNGPGGLISVSRFRCSWEASPEESRRFGLNICDFDVVIDRNVARRATLDAPGAQSPFRRG